MTNKKVSLKDMAGELNLSLSTVSRALKDHPDISTEVKNKVQLLARKWNYPISKKKDHKQAKTKTIGVIVPNVERSFYASIISGIENYAKKEGYFIIVANSRETYQNEVECVENLLNLSVDGLIVCLSQNTEDYHHFDKARKKDIPMVFFDRVCRTNEFSSVIADNTEAAKAITKHLIESGAQKVAHIAGPKNLSITRERIAGYTHALQESNRTVFNEHLVYCDLTSDGAAKAVQRLIQSDNRPDAIFCVNDTVAYVTMKTIKQMGYSIPNDISVTGFNNEFHSSFVEPALTTVFHPTFEMGQETARLLIGQMNSDYPHSPRQIVMKTGLVIRESSIKKSDFSIETNQSKCN